MIDVNTTNKREKREGGDISYSHYFLHASPFANNDDFAFLQHIITRLSTRDTRVVAVAREIWSNSSRDVLILLVKKIRKQPNLLAKFGEN
jgi:hypothetical protein